MHVTGPGRHRCVTEASPMRHQCVTEASPRQHRGRHRDNTEARHAVRQTQSTSTGSHRSWSRACWRSESRLKLIRVIFQSDVTCSVFFGFVDALSPDMAAQLECEADRTGSVSHLSRTYCSTTSLEVSCQLMFFCCFICERGSLDRSRAFIHYGTC